MLRNGFGLSFVHRPQPQTSSLYEPMQTAFGIRPKKETVLDPSSDKSASQSRKAYIEKQLKDVPVVGFSIDLADPQLWSFDRHRYIQKGLRRLRVRRDKAFVVPSKDPLTLPKQDLFYKWWWLRFKTGNFLGKISTVDPSRTEPLVREGREGPIFNVPVIRPVPNGKGFYLTTYSPRFRFRRFIQKIIKGQSADLQHASWDHAAFFLSDPVSEPNMYLLKAYQLITGKYRFWVKPVPLELSVFLPTTPYNRYYFASRLRDLTQSNAQLGAHLEPVWGYWNNPISLAGVVKALKQLNKVILSSEEGDLGVVFHALRVAVRDSFVQEQAAMVEWIAARDSRIDLFIFNFSYCFLFKRLDRLHKLMLKQFSTVSLREKKRSFVKLVYHSLVLGSTELSGPYMPIGVEESRTIQNSNDHLDFFSLVGSVEQIHQDQQLEVCQLSQNKSSWSRGLIQQGVSLECVSELLVRLDFIFLCLDGLPEAFMDFLIFVCIKTRLLSWEEFRCLWGPLTGSILTLVRAGLKRFVRRYAIVQNRVQIEVRSAYKFQIPSRVSYLLLRKIRDFLGKNSDLQVGINVRLDNSVGCGIVVFVGENRLVLDFTIDGFFSALKEKNLVFKPSWT